MKSIAIIGSAGRGSDAKRMDEDLYDAMYAEAEEAVLRFGIEEAVSGGAAFADHIAVSLFLKGAVDSLRLYLPAVFDGNAYVPNRSVHANPGQTTNDYHVKFRDACGIDGLTEIAEAISRGANAQTYPGFKRRNLEVAANCTHMIAFTFGVKASNEFLPDNDGFTSSSEAGLKDGGTAHTWGQCWKAEWKRHSNLFLLIPEATDTNKASI